MSADAFRIDQVSVQGFRCFDRLDLQLDPSLTVLVANNGEGKTALLEALCVTLGPYVSAFDEGKDYPIALSDIRLLRSTPEDNTMEMVESGARVEARGVMGQGAGAGPEMHPGDCAWRRERRGGKSTTTRKDARALSDYGKALQARVRQEASAGAARDSAVVLPVVAYYDTGRLWHVRRRSRQLKRTSRMVGYARCLEAGTDYQLLADWLRYWSINSWRQRIEAEQAGRRYQPGFFEDALGVVREAVDRCLGQATGWYGVDYSAARDDLVAQHPDHGELPVAMLSDGIRSMFALVADIAFRMVKLNPGLGQQAAGATPGVVLIDEIDMHLHPAWQQQVVEMLQAAFPRVQFVVTTHSPQVLTTVDCQHIRVLESIHETETGGTRIGLRTPDTQSRGAPSPDALRHVMGVDPRPDVEEVRKLDRYQYLVESNGAESEEAQALRQELVAHFGAHHPLIYECDNLLRRKQLQQRLRGAQGQHP